MKRPTSVTVIAWILIVMSSLSLVTSVLTFNNPMVKEVMAQSPLPLSIQFAMMYVGLFVTLVSGIAMLMGRNWARFLYVGWSVIGFIVGLLTSPMKAAMIPGIVVFAVIAFFLFRPKATAFFTAGRP